METKKGRKQARKSWAIWEAFRNDHFLFAFVFPSQLSQSSYLARAISTRKKRVRIIDVSCAQTKRICIFQTSWKFEKSCPQTSFSSDHDFGTFSLSLSLFAENSIFCVLLCMQQGSFFSLSLFAPLYLLVSTLTRKMHGTERMNDGGCACSPRLYFSRKKHLN